MSDPDRESQQGRLEKSGSFPNRSQTFTGCGPSSNQCNQKHSHSRQVQQQMNLGPSLHEKVHRNKRSTHRDEFE